MQDKYGPGYFCRRETGIAPRSLALWPLAASTLRETAGTDTVEMDPAGIGTWRRPAHSGIHLWLALPH